MPAKKQDGSEQIKLNTYVCDILANLTIEPVNNIREIVGLLHEKLNPSATAFGLYNSVKQSLNYRCFLHNNQFTSFETNANRMICTYAAQQEGETVRFENLEGSDFLHSDYLISRHTFRSFAAHSKKVEENLVAFTAVFSTQARKFTETEITLIKELTGILVHQEQLLQHQLKQLDELEKYKQLFNTVNDGIFVLNGKGVFIDANTKATQLFSCERNELIGSTPAVFSPEYQDDGLTSKEKAWHYIQTAREAGGKRFHWKHKTKEGILFNAEVSLSKANYQGEIVLYAVVRDISQPRKTEKQLIDAKQKAEESDKLKSAFLANMSHEIRTPLNTIIGFSGLLMDEETHEDDKQHFLNLISNAGNSLLCLIDDIIDISKIEAGQLKLTKSETEVNELLDELKSTFENEKKKHDKLHINIFLHKPQAGEKLYLFTDPYRLKQILTNLLSNALKFVDTGYFEFGYNALDDRMIQFFVKDTGIGIEKQQKHLIFTRFGQADKRYKKNLDGTGLGLAISKHLVEILGGNIWFDSEIEKGSTFYFTLPVEPENLQSKAGYKKSGRIVSDWSDKILLIVDDVEANYRFLKAVLRDTHALLLWAKNGEEAIKICRNNHSINLVLMDIRMPNIDGYKATQEIKSMFPALPVIAQTAFADEEDRHKALNAGCDDYITKPICLNELSSVIQKFVSRT